MSSPVVRSVVVRSVKGKGHSQTGAFSGGVHQRAQLTPGVGKRTVLRNSARQFDHQDW
jgi:hypothetical protein